MCHSVVFVYITAQAYTTSTSVEISHDLLGPSSSSSPSIVDPNSLRCGPPIENKTDLDERVVFIYYDAVLDEDNFHPQKISFIIYIFIHVKVSEDDVVKLARPD